MTHTLVNTRRYFVYLAGVLPRGLAGEPTTFPLHGYPNQKKLHHPSAKHTEIIATLQKLGSTSTRNGAHCCPSIRFAFGQWQDRTLQSSWPQGDVTCV